jgi:flagellum-specific ATP synthase
LFPSIDVLRSVSRLISDIATPEQVQAANQARDALATYAEAADLIQIGAYVAGSDPRVDSARAAVPRIEALIRQKLDESVPRAAAISMLRAATGGKA